jgi:hypothetical protein
MKFVQNTCKITDKLWIFSHLQPNFSLKKKNLAVASPSSYWPFSKDHGLKSAQTSVEAVYFFLEYVLDLMLLY